MQQMIALLVKEIDETLELQRLAMFIGNLLQVPGMRQAPKLSFLSVNHRLMAAAAVYGEGVLLYGLLLNPVGIILGAALNGIAYGILLPALCEGVMKSVLGQLYTTAQEIAEMVHSVVGATVGNLAFRILISDIGLRGLMYLAGTVEVLAFIILMVAGRRR